MTQIDRARRRQDDAARQELRRLVSDGRAPSDVAAEAFGSWQKWIAPLRATYYSDGPGACPKLFLEQNREQPALSVLLHADPLPRARLGRARRHPQRPGAHRRPAQDRQELADPAAGPWPTSPAAVRPRATRGARLRPKRRERRGRPLALVVLVELVRISPFSRIRPRGPLTAWVSERDQT